MDIRALGEFGLIRRLQRMLPAGKEVVSGIGDDCAVLPFGKKDYLLWTCDMLVEGVDFTRRDAPVLVGRKALAVNVSDIAACAGDPRWALVALGVPKGTPVRYIDGFYRGMRRLAKEFGISVVGGDISRSDKIVIDVSLLGVVGKKQLVLRSGARAGDVVFVTGRLGGSLSGRHLRFQPRVREARRLAGMCRVHAMIDISDGLSSDIGHICRASGVGADLFRESIPAYPGVTLDQAFNDGEDFELLFCVAPRDARIVARSGLGCFAVGRITDDTNKVVLVDRRGRRLPLTAGGFRHF